MRIINAKMSYEEKQRWEKKNELGKRRYLNMLKQEKRAIAPPTAPEGSSQQT